MNLTFYYYKINNICGQYSVPEGTTDGPEAQDEDTAQLPA